MTCTQQLEMGGWTIQTSVKSPELQVRECPNCRGKMVRTKKDKTGSYFVVECPDCGKEHWLLKPTL